MALGADRAHLRRWIAGQGLKLTLVGIAVGGVLAASSARAVSGLLFGVRLTDPVAALAVACLPLIALVVSLHPAWRATRIDAAEVLRSGGRPPAAWAVPSDGFLATAVVLWTPMARQALTAAVLSLGMLIVPVLPLACGGSDRDATMACCREMGDRCNRSSMKDDCCRTAPGSDDGTPSATRAERTPRVDPLKAFAPVVLSNGPVLAIAFDAGRLMPPVMPAAPDASPSPPSILRV